MSRQTTDETQQRLAELAAAGRAAKTVPGPGSPTSYRAEQTGTEAALNIIGGLMLACGMLTFLGGVFLVFYLEAGETRIFALPIVMAGVYLTCASVFVFALRQILRHLRRMEDLLWPGLDAVCRTLEQGGKR